MKILKKILIFGVLCFCLSNIVNADVIPENSHRFERCVKIENPKEIKGFKLVVAINTANGYNSVYQVKNNTCLQQHYIFGISTPYLIQKDIDIKYLNELAETLGNDWVIENYLGNKFIKFDAINPNGGYVSNTSNKTYENITYKLIQENGEYKLIISNMESDEISSNNDGTWVSNDKISGTIQTQIDKSYIFKFLQSRIVTVLLETFALFFLCKLFFKQDEIKNGKIILTGIVASTCTLPILWFVLPNIFHNWTVFAIIGEVFVTIVEVFIIKYMLNIKRRKAIIASTACNLFSVIVGLFL